MTRSRQDWEPTSKHTRTVSRRSSARSLARADRRSCRRPKRRRVRRQRRHLEHHPDRLERNVMVPRMYAGIDRAAQRRRPVESFSGRRAQATFVSAGLGPGCGVAEQRRAAARGELPSPPDTVATRSPHEGSRYAACWPAQGASRDSQRPPFPASRADGIPAIRPILSVAYRGGGDIRGGTDPASAFSLSRVPAARP